MFLRVSIFYVLTWFLLVLLGGIQQETGLFPPEIGLPQWAPGIAALLMLLIFRKDGHKIILFAKDVPALRYILAVLIPAGVGLLTYLISFGITMESVDPAPTSQMLIILWAPLGALGEEIGWRGYLHKRLDTRWRGLYSSLLVGLLWMPIHIHFFAEGLVFIAFFTISIVAYSIVIYALAYDTGFNVLLATIFHLAINLTNLLFLDVIYSTSFMVVNGIIWATVAGLLVLWKIDIFLTPKRFLEHE
jgi:membrane protease YdiL (CAAX protease family)